MSIMYIRDKNGTFVPVPSLEGKDAYEYAVEAGFEGKPEDLGKNLARPVPEVTQKTGNDTKATMSQAAITAALENLTTLPYGGSKEWLDNNGDHDQLYQIDGYVWAYIESNGWTRSGTQFLVVSSESEMTNEGGTPYLLRSGDEGVVYSFTPASGDAGIPVYGSLPTSANNGDIVAVNGKKHKATVTTTEVLNCKNHAVTTDDPSSTDDWSKGYRISSSGAPSSSTENRYVTNKIYCQYGDIIRTKGLNVYRDSGGALNIGFYKSDGTMCGTLAMVNVGENGTWEVNGDEAYFTVGFGNTAATYKNTAYVRMTVELIDGYTLDDVVITVNEEITTKNVTTVKWTEIGEYVTPVEAGWDATSETHSVIESLSETSYNGDTAVYSVDGYLYSYLSGASWMQSSKYSAPTLYVDGELSFTSTNAIQNKAVAEAIDTVQAKANSNANEINALNVKMANIETGSNTVTVPTFWQSAVDAVIAKIKALQVGRNCITFPFFSDNHQRNGYAGILISHIMKACNIPYCFCGGDSISNGYIDSEATMIAQDKAFDTMMSYVPNGRFCRAVGNHDGYWAVSANEKYYYNRDQIYDLFLREESIAQNKYFGEDGTYYYVDEIVSKTRFVVMNTNRVRDDGGNLIGDTFGSAQLAWLQNEALNFTESGWTVVFIGHAPITNNFHSEMTNAVAVQTIIDNHNKSTSANKADVVGWFAGHIHRDRIYWTDHSGSSKKNLDDQTTKTLSFPTITITSDHTSIAYDDATKHTVASDDQSHAIDFITINKSTRTVNITRLGVGEDRSYTY